MAWNDTKNEGDLISNTDWNDHVSVTMQTSGAFWAHSSNSNIHYTQDSITTVGTITNGIWHGSQIEQQYLKSGSQYYDGYLHSSNSSIHLTPTQRTDLTDGGDSSLHYHSSDRNLSNATGILDIPHGGTNNSSYTNSKFIIYDGSKLTSSGYDNTSFASASHTHDASDITTGTLSNDRFSAYSDLVAESKIGSSDSQVASGSHLHDNRYYTKSQSDSNYYPSSLGHDHVSDSTIHFTKSSIYLNDLGDTNVPSPTSGNSLTWNGSSWIEKKIQGVSNLSDLNIDIDKDWSSHGIYNLSFVSSQTISGGTIKGVWNGEVIQDAYIANDITLDNITQITNRSHTNLTDIGSYTHNQIDSHIDDSSIHYTQSNITTVGTITTGVWHASPIEQNYLASGEAYWSAYLSSQNLGNLAFKDSVDISDDTNLSVNYPITITNDTIGINIASSTVSGALKASDWSIFNNKQDSFTFGTLSNGVGIQSFSVGISGSNATVSVSFGKTDTTVASGSHLHDDRYYTESEADSNFFPSSLGHSHINNISNPHSVTYSQVGAIQDANDTVKDSHIDWGTGTNQVSLDDVPDGSSYARLTTTQKTDLTDGGDTTLHYHSSDRDLSNATGTLGINHGGTNNTSYTNDKFLIYDGSKVTSSSYDSTSFANASHTHSASDITTGTLAHERGGLEADVSTYDGLVKIAGGTTSYITDNSSNWNTAYSHSQTTTGNPHQISVDDLTNTNISTPKSGQILTYAADNSNTTWQNVMPPMTFSTPTVALKGNRFIRLARFKTPSDTTCYLWRAQASDINGNSVYGLKVELLSGSTVLYSTSSNEIVTGYPLKTAQGDITIRFTYSGSGISDTDDVQGLGFMQVSVY